MPKLKIALIGCGNWGMNYLRLLNHSLDAELVFVADTNPATLAGIQQKISTTTKLYEDYRKGIETEKPQAVIIATPLSTHFEICVHALKNNLHVLCEKPVSTSESELVELKRLAEKRNLCFFPGHVFVFNQGIQFIKNFLQTENFGTTYYLNFQRTGLGPFRTDASVVEDLATHDFSILLNLLSEKPSTISMKFFTYESKLISDTAYVTLYYDSKIHATIHASWIHPIKERRINIVGSRMMIVFDDTSISEKVKLYKRDRSYNTPNPDFGEFQMAIRGGETLVPDIQYSEPLKLQLNNFFQTIVGREKPLVNIDDALYITKIFSAGNESARNEGNPVPIVW